ncbi:MAG: hypothetical protein CMM78_07505 [Rhodospirillaceae bacterium]|jgi:uncharacterized protein (DUF2336 family)|uniref:DUF2336 domain-containing protein n=1 Tax=Hwanghaeella sp. 1Z406 TaxID=3402811 RepID=UPI000C6738C0|nr:hypothetical protein [Rhodospirillaceae bacterium]|tara:strand:+ start:55961 stop:57091 length:1131 start_codon:yes stop_codon:yes gene_type:complete
MAEKLTGSDVQKLLADPSGENRASAAHKIARQFGEGGLTDKERSIAEDIFSLMVKDVEMQVRAALSSNLKDVPGLSNDLAKTLASDLSDEVALPMLQYSNALTDADLVEIVRSQNASRTKAVAERPAVSRQVSDAIVTHGDEDSVVALVSNTGAEISETSLNKVVDKYGDVPRIQEPLVQRPTLPVSIAEKLVARVADHLKDYLVQHHELSDEMATDLILQSRERATLTLNRAGSSGSAEELVRQLKENRRLTPSIVLRALCVGDLDFFEQSLSVLSGVPINNARILIHDEGELGLRSLYQKAGMPVALLPAYRTALDMVVKAEMEQSDEDPQHRMRRLLERVLTEHEEIIDEFGADTVDYLLTKLNRLGQASKAA